MTYPLPLDPLIDKLQQESLNRQATIKRNQSQQVLQATDLAGAMSPVFRPIVARTVAAMRMSQENIIELFHKTLIAGGVEPNDDLYKNDKIIQVAAELNGHGATLNDLFNTVEFTFEGKKYKLSDGIKADIISASSGSGSLLAGKAKWVLDNKMVAVFIPLDERHTLRATGTYIVDSPDLGEAAKRAEALLGQIAELDTKYIITDESRALLKKAHEALLKSPPDIEALKSLRWGLQDQFDLKSLTEIKPKLGDAGEPLIRSIYAVVHGDIESLTKSDFSQSHKDAIKRFSGGGQTEKELAAPEFRIDEYDLDGRGFENIYPGEGLDGKGKPHIDGGRPPGWNFTFPVPKIPKALIHTRKEGEETPTRTRILASADVETHGQPDATPKVKDDQPTRGTRGGPVIT